MRSLLFAAMMVSGSAAYAASTDDYIALGDSIAFGYQPIPPYTNTASFADQGYVSHVADFIGGAEGGVRPNVINLAIPEETTTSFFDTSNQFRIANLNYAPTYSESQATLFENTVASELGAGHTISTVSFALGSNDLLGLLDSSSFLSESTALQLADVNSLFTNTVAPNLAAEVGVIRTALPNAKLLVIGFYNPFDVFPLNNPFRIESDTIIAGLNGILAQDAFLAGGTYVDVTGAFAGHTADYTYVDTPLQDVHPNDAGYAAIAGQIKPSVAPAPSAAFMMLAGLVSARRRKKSA